MQKTHFSANLKGGSPSTIILGALTLSVAVSSPALAGWGDHSNHFTSPGWDKAWCDKQNPRPKECDHWYPPVPPPTMIVAPASKSNASSTSNASSKSIASSAQAQKQAQAQAQVQAQTQALNNRLAQANQQAQTTTVVAPSQGYGPASFGAGSCRWGDVGIDASRDTFSGLAAQNHLGGHVDVLLGPSGYACHNSEAAQTNTSTSVVVHNDAPTTPQPQPPVIRERRVVVYVPAPPPPCRHRTAYELAQVYRDLRLAKRTSDVARIGRDDDYLTAACRKDLRNKAIDP